MKILIVNKFYYNRGGDCVCAISLEQMLREQGHETAVFAMQYAENFQLQHYVLPGSRVYGSGHQL